MACLKECAATVVRSFRHRPNHTLVGEALHFPFASPPAVRLRGAVSVDSDNIVAPATPAGVSALALVRVSGGGVAELTRSLFGAAPPPRQVQRADFRDSAGGLVDDVLFTFFSGPHSYTGQDTLEISCHGNPLIVRRILADLGARGCRLAEAGEFTRRAFLNGRLELSQAEAVMDLIHAKSERALAAANQQLRGSLGRRMEGLTAGLVAALAQVEAHIDFPEEDLPAEDREQLRRVLADLLRGTRQLLATGAYGSLLREGIRTVIVGAPNAGKSSLLNCLAGKERALVSPEPGTTRDYLEEFVQVGPHVLRLVDTAGLNPAALPLEKRGMDKTLEQAEAADLFLWVVDASAPLPSLPGRLEEIMHQRQAILVLNKSDLLVHEGMPIERVGIASVFTSALKEHGIDRLRDQIVASAEAYRQEAGDEIVVVNTRHAVALEEAAGGLERALAGVLEEAGGELVASDMRVALEAFGRIAGKMDNEKVLDELFKSFCIGK